MEMRPIQMVDLKQQYLKIKDDVDAGIKDVIENTAPLRYPLREWNRCAPDRHDGA